MTAKLALLNVKKRWQDYAVLLMGLVISVAIFYMFQTLSTNVTFLTDIMPQVAAVGIIFKVGSVMLGMMTVVYILYANSFLLSMRKKEYGMYMMFGAKKKKIRQMMSVETLTIGVVSIAIGVLLGTLFSKVMSQVLMDQLRLQNNMYQAFNLSAILITVVFFAILFIITASINSLKFSKTKLLDLLNEDQTSEKFKLKKVRTVLLTLVSILLMTVGYWCLWHINETQLAGIITAMFTITIGTFFFFGALFPLVVNLFKNWDKFSQKKLRIFTLSQLSFKANAISRVLAMVTMMLALSLGAMTVGIGFNHHKEVLLTEFSNDLVTYNPTKEINNEIKKLSLAEDFTYHVKKEGNNVYYLADELVKQPLAIEINKSTGGIVNPQDIEYQKYSEFKSGQVFSMTQKNDSGEKNYAAVIDSFTQLNNPYEEDYYSISNYHVLDQVSFDKINAKENIVRIAKSNDFTKDIEQYDKINALEVKRKNKGNESNYSKYEIFTMITGMISGFVFMGAFLGIAFLAMLASCLMFKILSGAHQDIPRYQMLHKIGIRRNLMVKSIRQEIGLIFIVPAVLGATHVLFGLKMFEIMLPNPYGKLWLPFGLFGIIYVLYYVITVILYKKIVLTKK